MLDIITINEDLEDKDEIIEIVWKAYKYFPDGLWSGIEYFGNLELKYDVKIRSESKVYGAFIFKRLLERIRDVRRRLGIKDLLLGVTHDPVVTVYRRFEEKSFRNIVNLIYDYVSSEVGFVSLFNVAVDFSSLIVAHGLGHNQGLKHHIKPVDVMYSSLLSGSAILKEGFCEGCEEKLRRRVED